MGAGMSDVIFARTRTVYDSYIDYFKLAELSGYPIVYCDEIDVDSDNLYIFTPLNGENNHGWPVSRATIVLWDGEWRLKESDYQWSDSDLVVPPGVSRVWASDKWYAERIHAEYVPLGSHPGLVGTAQTDETFDIATMCYIWGRRGNITTCLQERGVSIAPNGWGDERDALLKSSSALLHIHQHAKVHTVAPLRYAIAAAWHLPLISESVYDRGIFETSVLYADYDALADYAALMVKRYGRELQSKADELHNQLCIDGSFRKFIDAAV